MKIRIADLDLSLQTRVGTDADTVNGYAEAMADGAQFPEVTVFTDGTTYWLADGFHRVMAARQNGRTTIAADVRKGTEDDAVVFGGTANNRQGRRPTRADVQHFLLMVWERREAIFGGTPTGGNLAERCGITRQAGTKFVSEKLAEMQQTPVRPTVNNLQLAMDGKVPARPVRLIGANGKSYPVRPVRPSRSIAQKAQCPAPVAPVRPSPPPAPERPARKSSEIEDWPRDRYGVQIPQELLGVFAESTARDQLESMLRSAERLARGALEAQDRSMANFCQSDLLELQNVLRAAKFAKPHCVCRMCQGTGCRACRETGFQTKMQYENNPKEFQA